MKIQNNNDVLPAKAVSTNSLIGRAQKPWIPVFAVMTAMWAGTIFDTHVPDNHGWQENRGADPISPDLTG
ncbi:MAG: hypothetical protein WBQ78_14780 [Gammaproteobacteria bacterium]